MGSAVGKITDTLGLTDYSGIMDQTRAGGQAALGGMEEALAYLREADEMPRQFREQAMQRLADVYGFGKPKAQKQFYKGLTKDPFYEMMSQGAEEAYLRNQSATGDLRGGASIMGVANLENQIRQATMANQLSGIQGMMDMPDYTESIYGGISGIGQQKGMNIMNLAQQQQANDQAAMGNVIGLGTMLAGFGMSDARLKENLVEVGRGVNDLMMYEFNYKGSNERFKGYIAQDVQEVDPDSVVSIDGYLAVTQKYAPEKIH